MTNKADPEGGEGLRDEAGGGAAAAAAGAAPGGETAAAEMPPGFSTEEFNARLGPRWKEGDPKDRVDPTRFARVTLAMKRIRRLTPDRQHSDQNYPYASKGAVYDHIRECLADCGLHIRARLNKPIEISAER